MALCLRRRAACEEVLRVVVGRLRGICRAEIGAAGARRAAIHVGGTGLGAAPMAKLNAEQVRPIGPVGMPGVWYRGLRAVCPDGSTLEEVGEADNGEHDS